MSRCPVCGVIVNDLTQHLRASQCTLPYKQYTKILASLFERTAPISEEVIQLIV